MTPLEVVTEEANQRTDPKSVCQRANGDIEVITHDAGAKENEPLVDGVIDALARAGYSFKCSWISAIRVVFEEIH